MRYIWTLPKPSTLYRSDWLFNPKTSIVVVLAWAAEAEAETLTNAVSQVDASLGEKGDAVIWCRGPMGVMMMMMVKVRDAAVLYDD